MQRLFTEMEDSDRLLPLHVGLDATGSGSAFIARNFVSPALVAHAMLEDSPAGLPIVTASMLVHCVGRRYGLQPLRPAALTVRCISCQLSPQLRTVPLDCAQSWQRSQRDMCGLQGGFNSADASLHVAVPELTEGSLLQLHVRDANWSQKGVSTCLQVCGPGMQA